MRRDRHAQAQENVGRATSNRNSEKQLQQLTDAKLEERGGGGFLIWPPGIINLRPRSPAVPN
jgi:hypothetical protein